MKELFDCVLDSDEVITKVIRPNKFRAIYVGLIFRFIFMFLIASALLIVGILFVTGYFKVEQDMSYISIPFFIWAGMLYVAFFFITLVAGVSYNKTYYAYSNKRVIVRTGFIGIDFRTLDMGMIGSVNVTVSLLDKIPNPNTGRISFGSMASPLVAKSSPFAFVCIDDPYGFYREIKSVIDEYKKANGSYVTKN